MAGRDYHKKKNCLVANDATGYELGVKVHSDPSATAGLRSTRVFIR